MKRKIYTLNEIELINQKAEKLIRSNYRLRLAFRLSLMCEQPNQTKPIHESEFAFYGVPKFYQFIACHLHRNQRTIFTPLLSRFLKSEIPHLKVNRLVKALGKT